VPSGNIISQRAIALTISRYFFLIPGSFVCFKRAALANYWARSWSRERNGQVTSWPTEQRHSRRWPCVGENTGRLEVSFDTLPSLDPATASKENEPTLQVSLQPGCAAGCIVRNCVNYPKCWCLEREIFHESLLSDVLYLSPHQI